MKLVASLAQMAVADGNPEANLEKAKGFLEEAAGRGSDMVVFPEMWTTGFDWEWCRENASAHAGIVERVGALARQYGMWLFGSMLSGAPEAMANALFVFDPHGGRAAVYAKTHLFRPGGEDRWVVPGDRVGMVKTPWGQCGLAVCYDVRFPELFRRQALGGARLAVLSTGFPKVRIEDWRLLVRARAMENQMFVLGADRVGRGLFNPGKYTVCGGRSLACGPNGAVLAEAGESEETLLTVEIDMELCGRVREKADYLGDRRPDVYRRE